MTLSMNIKNSIVTLIALVGLILLFAPTIAFAQAATEPPAATKLLSMLPMFIIVFFIFYFLVIKPQNQKLKNHQDLVSNLKKGDLVVTSSGMVAKVSAIEERIVVVEAGSNVKLKFEKDHISKLYSNESTTS